VVVRPVAVMHMLDTGESDDKIIAVPVKDPRWDYLNDLEDINKHTLKEITHFFETYKINQNDEVKIGGFENKAKAMEAVKRSVELYKAKFAK
jgi:inorganic pyrophosphatase